MSRNVAKNREYDGEEVRFDAPVRFREDSTATCATDELTLDAIFATIKKLADAPVNASCFGPVFVPVPFPLVPKPSPLAFPGLYVVSGIEDGVPQAELALSREDERVVRRRRRRKARHE